jgi:hypothetical protein
VRSSDAATGRSALVYLVRGIERPAATAAGVLACRPVLGDDRVVQWLYALPAVQRGAGVGLHHGDRPGVEAD